MQYDAAELSDLLFCGDAAPTVDALPFGVIGLNADDEVVVYNEAEALFTGLPAAMVMGKDFFEEVAPCMNNYMVAQRLEDEPELDETLDYVLTLKMRPTKVKLRLIKKEDQENKYIIVQRS